MSIFPTDVMAEGREYLKAALSTPINGVLQKTSRPPVWVMNTDSIDKAFKKLFKNKIRSVPLYNVELNRFTDYIEVCSVLAVI